MGQGTPFASIDGVYDCAAKLCNFLKDARFEVALAPLGPLTHLRSTFVAGFFSSSFLFFSSSFSENQSLKNGKRILYT
jgi:hypothetical protein